MKKILVSVLAFSLLILLLASCSYQRRYQRHKRNKMMSEKWHRENPKQGRVAGPVLSKKARTRDLKENYLASNPKNYGFEKKYDDRWNPFFKLIIPGSYSGQNGKGQKTYFDAQGDPLPPQLGQVIGLTDVALNNAWKVWDDIKHPKGKK